MGVTTAGFKASQLNKVINLNTAEQAPQFGISKCKSMLIGKHIETVTNTALTEMFEGQTDIGKTDTYTYLGFVIASNGSNMPNIQNLKCISIGVVRKIITKLNSLQLQNYYFECAIILMNTILRGTILYACDMYFNLKETELRQI